jgi:hypothetical protein
MYTNGDVSLAIEEIMACLREVRVSCRFAWLMAAAEPGV